MTEDTFFSYVKPPEGYEWRTVMCSGGTDDNGDEFDCPFTYVAPIEIGADYHAGGPIDFCPLCKEHASILSSGPSVRVMSPTAEKWAQVQAARREVAS